MKLARTDESPTERYYRLVHPHLPAVLRAALVLSGGNDADADDLAQEAMLKAFAHVDQLAEGTNPAAWLMRIVRNCRIDRVRATAARGGPPVSLDDAELDPSAPAPAGEPLDAWSTTGRSPEAILDAFADDDVVRAMGRLPEEIRWTLLLADVQQMDHAEAAVVLGVPVGTVKSRVHRGRRMLRDALLPVARERRWVE